MSTATFVRRAIVLLLACLMMAVPLVQDAQAHKSCSQAAYRHKHVKITQGGGGGAETVETRWWVWSSVRTGVGNQVRKKFKSEQQPSLFNPQVKRGSILCG